MQFIRKLAVALVLAASLGGCAAQSFTTGDALRRDVRQPRILMMPPDVELFEVTAGGQLELNAEWTRQGTDNLTQAIKQHLADNKAQYVEYRAPADDTPEAATLGQVQKLHGAVGSTIQVFHVNENNRLPTKKNQFDWTLGPATRELASHADADYALFVWMRDSYSSPGRNMLKVATVLMLGVPVSGGVQFGHASLVDLKTGQVVWFSSLPPREAGDLRTRLQAGESVAQLLHKLPK